MTSDARNGLKITISTIILSVVISIAFFLLLEGWLALRVPENAPGYAFEGPIRQFFIGSIIIVLSLTYPIHRICRKERFYSKLTLSTGLLMAIMGIVGILIILPQFGVMSNPGGLTPDYGHTLTKDNLTGALWLFLLFSGPTIYLDGYLSTPSVRKTTIGKALPFTLGFSTYFIGVAIYDIISRIRETGGLQGKFLFSLTLALIIAIISGWIHLKTK